MRFSMKRFLIIIILVLNCIALNSKTLRVGIYENKPLVYIDDKKEPQGLFVDVIEYIAQKENWELEYVYQSWTDCLRLLEKDSIDILVDIAYTDKRKEIYDYNQENIFVNWGIVYVNDNTTKSMLDLNRKKIAGVKDDLYFDELILLLKKFDVICDYVYVDEYSEGLQLAEENKVDAAVVNRLFGSLNEHNFKLKKSEMIFRPSELRFATPKNKNQNILNAIDYHIKILKEDEESVYYQSINEHISGVRNTLESHQIIYLTGALILLSLLALTAFYFLKIGKNKNRKELFNNSFFKTNLPFPYLVFNQNLDIIQVNSLFKQLFDYDINSTSNKLNQFLVDPEDVKGLEYPVFKNVKIKYQNVPYEVSVLLTNDPENDNTYLYILDCLTVQQSLKNSNLDKELMFKLFNSLPGIHILFSENGSIIRVNKDFLKFFQYQDSELLYKNITDYLNPEIISGIKNHFSGSSSPYQGKAELINTKTANRMVNISVNHFDFNKESYYTLTLKNQEEQSLDLSKIRGILDDISSPVVITNSSDQIMESNNAFFRSFGWNKNELISKSISELIEDNDFDKFSDKEMHWSDVKVITSNNSQKDVQLIKVSIKINALNVIHVFLFNESSNFETSLKLFTDKFKSFKKLLSKSNDFVIVSNSNKDIFYTSSSIKDIQGFGKLKHINNYEFLKEIVYIDDQEEFFNIIFNDDSDIVKKLKQIRFYGSDNQELVFQLTLCKTNLYNQMINVTICHDVTDLIKSEKTNQNRILEMNDIINHMNDILISVNQYGEINYFNQYFIEKSGYNPADIKGKKIFDLIHISNKEGISNDLLMQSAFNKSVVIHDCKIEFEKTNNNIEHMSVNLTKYKNSDGKVFILMIIKDLSHIMKMQKELLKLKNLEILQKSSLHIANDFNNILTAIMGHIALLKMSPNIPESILDRIKKAEEASIKAKELTHRIFPLDNRANYQKDYYSVNFLLDNIIANKPEKIDFDIVIPSDLRPVYIVKENVELALKKILDNAYESMPGGGIIQIVVQETEMNKSNIFSLSPGSYISIKIIDKGNGIDPIYIEKVFEPYFSLKNKEGLGLTQAFHQLITQNAYANINSTLNEGTCVEVFLPEKPALQNNPESIKHIDRVIKILFMDDEQLVLDIALEYLNRLGFQVILVKNGEEVMQVLENENDIDIVILDLVVAEGMGAKETIKVIRERYPDLVVFLSTGLKTEITLLDYKKYGFNDVIEKPIDFLLLREKIYQILQ